MQKEISVSNLGLKSHVQEVTEGCEFSLILAIGKGRMLKNYMNVTRRVTYNGNVGTPQSFNLSLQMYVQSLEKSKIRCCRD